MGALGSCEPESAGLKLSYQVEVTSPDSSTIEVALEISGLNSPEVLLKSYEAEKYLRVSNVQVFTAEGTALKYKAVDFLFGETRDSTPTPLTYYRVDTEGRNDLQVAYQVRPGTPIGGGHGKHPMYASGYLGVDFGLVSGRNLFLVPDAPLGDVRVRVQAPAGWSAVSTWPQEDEGPPHFRPRLYQTRTPEDLVNGMIGLGSFRVHEKTVESTPVRIFVYAGWPEAYGRQLAERSFALYEYVSQLFAAPIADPYTLIFAPRTPDGLNIQTFATAHGQGREMQPDTPSRWIACGEEMIYRWLRYPPHRMEFSRVEDMWFVDGAAVYYALRACEATDIIADLDPYWIELYRGYNHQRLSNYERGVIPARLYEAQSRSRKLYRRQLGAVFVHYLDELIRRETAARLDLRTVLQHAYSRRHGLHLQEVIEEATQCKVGVLFKEHIDPDTLPVRPLAYAFDPVPALDKPVVLPVKQGKTAPIDTLSLVLTGKTQGYLEACGCKANQSGGITRRATLIEQIRKRRKNLAVLDAGNVFPEEDKVPYMDELSAAEVDLYLKALGRMGYQFSVITDNELYYGMDFLQRMLKASPVPLISANVLYNGQPLASPTRSVTIGPYRMGFIGIFQRQIGIEHSRFEDHTAAIEIADPLAVVGKYLPELRAQNDFVGVIGRLHTDLVYKVVETFPDLDVVITSGHHYALMDVLSEDGKVGEAKDALYGFLGKTLVIYANAGVYGLHHVDIGIGADGRFSSADIVYLQTYQDLPEDPAMSQSLEAFYREVAERESLLTGQIEPLFRWDTSMEGKEYVGTDQCATCHPAEYTQWRDTRHGSAYATLLDVHRHHYPKCVLCHVAGLGRPSGFDILRPDRALANVQCEICHGPGSLHLQGPFPTNIRRVPDQQLCLECHNTDHDDDFVYERDYRLVRHDILAEKGGEVAQK